ncbi:hypothetical protein [Lentzea roselyniae]|uniref:hypothetical protein n=1 Tax=Lentzea roselyniae TaxID=531940 RepID=UPI0031F9430A
MPAERNLVAVQEILDLVRPRSVPVPDHPDARLVQQRFEDCQIVGRGDHRVFHLRVQCGHLGHQLGRERLSHHDQYRRVPLQHPARLVVPGGLHGLHVVRAQPRADLGPEEDVGVDDERHPVIFRHVKQGPSRPRLPQTIRTPATRPRDQRPS